MKFLKMFLWAMAVLFFTACSAPVSDAGADQSVNVGDTVVLDGSGSTDDDGDELTFLWTMTKKPSDSNASLSNVLIVKPEFVADKEGNYTITLVVNDGNSDSDPDSVQVVAFKENAAPVANAGSDQNRKLGDTVVLDGSGSSDSDGDDLTYEWNITVKPASSVAVLSDGTSENPSFEADAEGNYTVALVVNDGIDDSKADEVGIAVTEPVTSNAVPVANAGPVQEINATVTDVTLDGSGSYDADNDNLTYRWSVTYFEGNTTKPAIAPEVKPILKVDVNGTYLIQLIVNDGTVDSLPDTTVVIKK